MATAKAASLPAAETADETAGSVSSVTDAEQVKRPISSSPAEVAGMMDILLSKLRPTRLHVHTDRLHIG